MIPEVEIWAQSCLKNNSPIKVMVAPPAANQRVPKRSASVPLNGAMTAIVSGSGVRSSPLHGREATQLFKVKRQHETHSEERQEAQYEAQGGREKDTVVEQ